MKLLNRFIAPILILSIASNAMADVLPKRPSGPLPKSTEKLSPISTPTIGELNEAVVAYQTGDYDKALKISTSLAERGDGNSAAMVGFMYENGFGAARSYENAIKYYRQGALSDATDAMLGIGRIWVLSPSLVTIDEVQKAYEKAIKKGRDDALTPYGDFLLANNNLPKAAEIYAKAASKNNINAAYSYAILLDDGDDIVPDDENKAFAMLKIAADGNLAPAMADYGLFLYQGRGGVKNLPEAGKWFKAAAESGDKNGQFYWALINAKGEGVKQDITTAKKYAELSKDEVPEAARLYQQILNYENNTKKNQ